MKGLDERQSILQSSYRFECKCAACLENHPRFEVLRKQEVYKTVSSERILSTIPEQQALAMIKKLWRWLKKNEIKQQSARYFSVLGMHSIYFSILLKSVPIREQIRKIKIEEIPI